MRGHLYAAAVIFAALSGSAGAGAVETGGVSIASEINISPMTAAIVQSAQARVFAGVNGGLAQQQRNTGPSAATGNPATDRLLGQTSASSVARQALQAQLLIRAQTLRAQREAVSGFGGDVAFADGGGVQSGGVPVVQNITNNTLTQSGVITNVQATTNITGNNNTVAQSVSNVGNNGTFKGKAP